MDHPDTHRFKLERISSLEWNIPKNVQFVPVNFETEKMTEKLLASGFDPSVKTFFSILGVSYYLTLPVFTETLQSVAELSASQSALVFDYPQKSGVFPPRVERLRKITEDMGEIMQSGFDYDEISRALFSRRKKCRNTIFLKEQTVCVHLKMSICCQQFIQEVMIMNKIASFTVNHDTLEPGIYISRIDGDTVTYDLRMKKPNNGDYITPKSLHTIEHLLATYVRNSSISAYVIYAGPMGCRTGFYLILRDSISKEGVLSLVTEAFEFIAEFSGEIPGSQRQECGNYLEHDLAASKKDAAEYVSVLHKITINDFNYR